MTETTFVENEEYEEEYEGGMDDVEDIEETHPITRAPESKDEEKPEEPKKGPMKRFFGWIGDKFNKARKNPVVVGAVGFAAGMGATLGVQALANRFGQDEDEERAIETEFTEPMGLEEPEESFVPDEVVSEAAEEPAETVTEEV